VNDAARDPWNGTVLLAGGAYLVVGLVTAALAKSAPSHQLVVAWRLAAWVASAIVFTTHIAFEHVRLRNAPRTTAFHVAGAVAIGAFCLAAAATLHALRTAGSFGPLLGLALVLWPLLTAVPAFLIAFATASVLARGRGRR
jgi:hypothetical protein